MPTWAEKQKRKPKVKTGDERTGHHPSLPDQHKPPNWYCRVCKFGPMVDKEQPNCLSCGRDWFGNPGKIPSDEDKGFHPGIRPGISN